MYIKFLCAGVCISSYCARFVAKETILEVIKNYNKSRMEGGGERQEGGREEEMSTPEDRTC